MSEIRSRAVVSALEETFYRLLSEQAETEGTSISSYVRNLIIRDMLRKGKITEDVLKTVLVGTNYVEDYIP